MRKAEKRKNENQNDEKTAPPEKINNEIGRIRETRKTYKTIRGA